MVLDCFRQFAGIVGTLVDVGKATTKWESTTPVPNKVDVSVGIKINDKVYWITLEEEVANVDHQQHRRC